MTRHSTCRWCGAPIRWVTTERGRNMCVDPQPAAGGNVALIDTPTGPRAHVLTVAERKEWTGQVWMPHSATCTHVRTRVGAKRQI